MASGFPRLVLMGRYCRSTPIIKKSSAMINTRGSRRIFSVGPLDCRKGLITAPMRCIRMHGTSIGDDSGAVGPIPFFCCGDLQGGFQSPWFFLVAKYRSPTTLKTRRGIQPSNTEDQSRLGEASVRRVYFPSERRPRPRSYF